MHNAQNCAGAEWVRTGAAHQVTTVGWLKTLMGSARPPIHGYGELARRALAHSEWPGDTRPQPRSLAALFSKLDRSIELEWLAEREAVQRTLCLVLGCPLEAVHQVLAPLRSSESSSPRVRLEDVPFARALDLSGEPLPPGIPVEVLRPSAWRRLWWRAPSGSGRSLAGQWLRARGIAEFHTGRSWAEVAPRLPAAGPIYVELERSDGTEALAPELGRELIFVAAPAAPRGESNKVTSIQPLAPWRVIESAPPERMAGPLLEWLEARLPRDGAFEAEVALEWLAQPIAAGMLPTFGALLGAAGLLDARTLREARGKSLVELARNFVNERLEDATSKGSAEAQWLKRMGFDVIIKLAEAVLTGRDEAWDLSRTEDEWIELIPNEFRQSIDTEWVRWSLARAGGQSSVKELERALRHAPPGAYRLVRALIDARLLGARGGVGRLGIQPEFLKHTALVEARKRLSSEASPFGWGEALLRPHAAPSLLEALYARLQTDSSRLVDHLLELDLGSHPASIAAAEATFSCLGLRVLGGADVSSDQLRALWDEQLRWIVELPGELPRPRLLCFGPGTNTCPLATRGLWLLAALAISETLAVREGAQHPLLRPWTAETPPQALGVLLDEIFEQIIRPEVAVRDFGIEAFALAGRLVATHAEGHGWIAAHALARPTAIVRAVLADGLDATLLEGFGVHAIELQALRAECEREQLPWPRMAHALWQAFHASGFAPSMQTLFSPDSSASRELWPHMPPAAFEGMWLRWSDQGHAFPYAAFGRVQWLAFVSSWSRHFRDPEPTRDWTGAFEVMDLEWMQRAVREADVLHAAERGGPILRLLWRRFPAWATALLLDHIAQADAVAMRALLEAGDDQPPSDLLRTLAEGLSRREVAGAAMDEGRRWLHAQVTARAPAWREAYALLVELEQRRARARRARGF